MQQADFIWMNGELVRWEDAKVHVLTHALHYGSGVFEGIRAYETERGTVVGTTTAFVDLSFGMSPAIMGLAVGAIGFGGIFVASAVIAFGGSLLLGALRDSLVHPAARAPGTLPG